MSQLALGLAAGLGIGAAAAYLLLRKRAPPSPPHVKPKNEGYLWTRPELVASKVMNPKTPPSSPSRKSKPPEAR